jgi:hypothetical protein
MTINNREIVLCVSTAVQCVKQNISNYFAFLLSWLSNAQRIPTTPCVFATTLQKISCIICCKHYRTNSLSGKGSFSSDNIITCRNAENWIFFFLKTFCCDSSLLFYSRHFTEYRHGFCTFLHALNCNAEKCYTSNIILQIKHVTIFFCPLLLKNYTRAIPNVTFVYFRQLM